MTNPFETHGIRHLSASNLNKYTASPAAWCLSYLLKEREPTNAAMARGTAIEAGISDALFTGATDLDRAVKIALAAFDREMALSTELPEKKAKERANIADSVAHGVAALLRFGVPEKPVGRQHKIEVDVGVEVPCIGYLDFKYPGDIVDNKSTMRIPSQISASHARQGAIYGRAHGNHAIHFCYESPKRAVVLPLEKADADRHFAAVCHIAQTMRRFLALSTDAHELCGLVCPDYESFYFSNSQTRATAARVFGY